MNRALYYCNGPLSLAMISVINLIFSDFNVATPALTNIIKLLPKFILVTFSDTHKHTHTYTVSDIYIHTHTYSIYYTIYIYIYI